MGRNDPFDSFRWQTVFFFIEMGIALGGQVHHDSVTKDSRVVGVGWERGVGGGGQVG